MQLSTHASFAEEILTVAIFLQAIDNFELSFARIRNQEPIVFLSRGKCKVACDDSWTRVFAFVEPLNISKLLECKENTLAY